MLTHTETRVDAHIPIFTNTHPVPETHPRTHSYRRTRRHIHTPVTDTHAQSPRCTGTQKDTCSRTYADTIGTPAQTSTERRTAYGESLPAAR